MADDDSLSLFARDPGPAPARSTASTTPSLHAPLAERMRPRSLDEVVGQQALVGTGGPLRHLAEAGNLPSLILWGPPGCGKTTLARLLAGDPARCAFVALSAVTAGVRDVRDVVERAAHEARAGRRTVLFLDEIHRFNRAQQDALLPHVERGTVTLIGATTENPSFEVAAPLLSRCRVFTLKPLDTNAIAALLARALADSERGLGALALQVAPETLRMLAAAADGDARRALGLLEAAADLARSTRRDAIDADTLREVAGARWIRHDRDREQHYDVVSAFIKSVRGSDVDASLYWLHLMLEGGEDPEFIVRRLIILASEDIGLADPNALLQAMAASQALAHVGLPEAAFHLTQATVYLAVAPKSNALTAAMAAARRLVAEGPTPVVPAHLRDSHYSGAAQLGHGSEYQYAHEAPAHVVRQQYMPDEVDPVPLYHPTDQGREESLRQRLAWIDEILGRTGR
jgi:putative ATPase